MAKHDLALGLLRAELNRTTRESKSAADQRIRLDSNIQYDIDHGRTPETERQKERAEKDALVRANFIKIQSLIESIGVLEDDA